MYFGVPTVVPTQEATTLDQYCKAMCDRTAVCGLELAKSQAGPADAELVAKLEKSIDGDKAACTRGCLETPLDDDSRFQLERAEICLKKTSCDALSACVAAL